MPIRKIEAGRLITVASYDWVGPEGTIWYDEIEGDLRIGDGVTPGGRLLGTGGGGSGPRGYTGSQGYVGSQGLAGYTGSVGYVGSVGYTGSQGDIGYTGSAGESLTVEPNVGLDINSGTITTVYNTLISDDVQSIAVGGATAQPASTWKSKNIVEVLDTILFPDVEPTYTIPTISLSGSQSGIKEIGSTLSQSLTLIAVENDAGVFTGLTITRSGTSIASSAGPTGATTTSIAAQFGYTDPNNPNYSYTLSATDSVTVINGSINWSGTGTYSAGLPKQNNKGVTDTRSASVRSTSAPQAASSISANTITVTGIYPYFWGKSSTQPTTATIAASILAGTANKVLTAANGTVTVTYNAVGEYVWLAHASSYTAKTVWYNTELNRGNIGAGNFILTPITRSVNSPDAYWSNVNFSIYISDGATTTNGALEFRNS